MRFMRPELAVWFLAVPIVIGCWWLHSCAKSISRDKMRLNPDAAALSRLSGRMREAVVLVAAVVTVASLVTAAMGPQLRLEWETPLYEQRDLILVLDRSASMRAQDIKPSRFTRAIQEIKTFLRRKPEGIDRVALVGFAETALILSHLTRDVDSLYFFLDWIEEDPDPHFGTNLGEALASARDIIRRDSRPTAKMILSVSDGDDQGTGLASVIAALRSENSRVYAIGIGSDINVTIPISTGDGNTQPLADMTGKPLTTRFREETLRNIAVQTGGRYYRSMTGTELLAAISDAAIGEQRIIGSERSTYYREMHQFALLAAAVSLGLLLWVS
jgi:Ca-activated chloride channel family protein